MKFFTIIFATICLLTVTNISVAQTNFLSTNNVENIEVSPVVKPASISFNSIGIAKGIIKVKMYNEPAGIYTLQVKDADGKVLAVKEVQHTDNTTLEIVGFDKNFEGGTYQIEMTSPDNKKTGQTIMLLM